MMNSTPISFAQVFGYELQDGTTVKSVEIPIIQRDYAQGRVTKDVNRIRDHFVNALHKAVINPAKDSVKLDFVYGNVEDAKLIPLDGQQRLTTLFLLHWYVAKHELIAAEHYEFLSKFTYKTRFSSQHFCDKLVVSNPDFKSDILSTWIKDQNWFMYSWETDPTIKAMLVMIDKLHSKFKNDSNIWESLMQKENQAISFYFLPLEEMGVTDSLYIKMNSRGKPLTPFEHFKADFEDTILKVSKELHKEFIKKVDVDWVDMLWKYRGQSDVIDDRFMKYYRFVTEMICYQQEIEILDDDFELSAKVYGVENKKAQENLTTLFKSFDAWKKLGKIGAFFSSVFASAHHEKGKVLLFTENTNLFSRCCLEYGLLHGKRRIFTLNNTLLLFAVQQYLLHTNTVQEEEFKKRIRVVRNLVFNSGDEIRESRLLGLLSDTREIILNGSINSKTSGYSEIQKNQESEKVAWRAKYINQSDVLDELEDHKLLQGNIAIIGLEPDSNFGLLAQNFKSLFNGEIDYIKISRALLTIGDYSQRGTWRVMLGNRNDKSWRELFTQSNKRKHFSNTKAVLNSLLGTSTIDMSAHVNSLIDDYLNAGVHEMDWKYYLIKYPKMREGQSGIYYWYNDPERNKERQYQVYMMNTPQTLNGRHWNPFLYALSKSIKLKNKVSLEEYGALIKLIDKNQKVECKNSHWAFYDVDNVLIDKLMIKQNNDTDLEDRLEILENHLTNNLQKKQ